MCRRREYAYRVRLDLSIKWEVNKFEVYLKA